MRVRPIATPALGWVFAPFAFLIFATGITAAAKNPPANTSNTASLGESVTAALEEGDDGRAMNAWQDLCKAPLSPGGESDGSTAQTALLVAGRTMAARGGAWRVRCADLAKSLVQKSGTAPETREVARRLMSYATSSSDAQPRTAATIASASMP